MTRFVCGMGRLDSIRHRNRGESPHSEPAAHDLGNLLRPRSVGMSVRGLSRDIRMVALGVEG